MCRFLRAFVALLVTEGALCRLRGAGKDDSKIDNNMLASKQQAAPSLEEFADRLIDEIKAQLSLHEGSLNAARSRAGVQNLDYAGGSPQLSYFGYLVVQERSGDDCKAPGSVQL